MILLEVLKIFFGLVWEFCIRLITGQDFLTILSSAFHCFLYEQKHENGAYMVVIF